METCETKFEISRRFQRFNEEDEEINDAGSKSWAWSWPLDLFNRLGELEKPRSIKRAKLIPLERSIGRFVSLITGDDCREEKKGPVFVN